MLVFLAFSFSTPMFSQSMFDGKKKFIYGKMVGTSDTLIGYFWFDNQITQNGQTVHYKEDLSSNSANKFQSRNYNYFESDSIYLETFGAIPTATGDILIMIPRIINGSIQLFDSKYRWGNFNLMLSEHFFIKKGNQKLRIKKKDFKGLLMGLVWDDEALLNRITNGELKYDDLMEIVATYNNSHPINNN